MRLLGGCESPDNEKPTLTQPWQDRVALGLGPPASGDLPCLSLDGMAFPQTEFVHKFGVYLNLQLFLYEEVVAMAEGKGGALHWFIFWTNWALSWTGRPCSQSLMRWILSIWNTAIFYSKLFLKTIWKLQLIECGLVNAALGTPSWPTLYSCCASCTAFKFPLRYNSRC